MRRACAAIGGDTAVAVVVTSLRRARRAAGALARHAAPRCRSCCSATCSRSPTATCCWPRRWPRPCSPRCGSRTGACWSSASTARTRARSARGPTAADLRAAAAGRARSRSSRCRRSAACWCSRCWSGPAATARAASTRRLVPMMALATLLAVAGGAARPVPLLLRGHGGRRVDRRRRSTATYALRRAGAAGRAARHVAGRLVACPARAGRRAAGWTSRAGPADTRSSTLVVVARQQHAARVGRIRHLHRWRSRSPRAPSRPRCGALCSGTACFDTRRTAFAHSSLLLVARQERDQADACPRSSSRLQARLPSPALRALHVVPHRGAHAGARSAASTRLEIGGFGRRRRRHRSRRGRRRRGRVRPQGSVHAWRAA